MFFKNKKINPGNNFDFLRFVFALIVVCAHCVVLTEKSQLTGWWTSIFDTYIAICGFFVISGFLVTKSFLSAKSIGSYFEKRTRRLLPAYASVIILCIFLLSFLSDLSFGAYFSSVETLKYFLANITFLNFLHPTLPGVFTQHTIPAVDGALWTIKVEVGFYLLLPLVILLINKCRSFQKGLFLLFTFYFASVLFRQLFIYWGELLNSRLIMDLSHQLPGFLSYFLSGALLFVLYEFFLKHKNFIVLMAIPVFLMERYFDWEVLRPLALACIVIYAAFSFPFLNRFGKYGDISYGIYIFHFPIIQVLITLGFYDQNPLLAFVATVLMVCIVGFLSWHLIEKQFLSRSRLKHQSFIKRQGRS